MDSTPTENKEIKISVQSNALQIAFLQYTILMKKKLKTSISYLKEKKKCQHSDTSISEKRFLVD